MGSTLSFGLPTDVQLKQKAVYKIKDNAFNTKLNIPSDVSYKGNVMQVSNFGKIYKSRKELPDIYVVEGLVCVDKATKKFKKEAVFANCACKS